MDSSVLSAFNIERQIHSDLLSKLIKEIPMQGLCRHKGEWVLCVKTPTTSLQALTMALRRACNESGWKPVHLKFPMLSKKKSPPTYLVRHPDGGPYMAIRPGLDCNNRPTLSVMPA